MKEKVSCSLDGDLVNQIDFIIEFSPPYINSRSAVIEMALINLIDVIQPYDMSAKRFLENLYFRRCDLDARKESTN